MRFSRALPLLAGLASGLAVIGIGISGMLFWEAHSLRQEVATLRLRESAASALRSELAVVRSDREQLQRRLGELETEFAALKLAGPSGSVRPARVRILASGQVVALGWMQPSPTNTAAGTEPLVNVVIDQTLQTAQASPNADNASPVVAPGGSYYRWWYQTAPLWWVSGPLISDGNCDPPRPDGSPPSGPEPPPPFAPPPAGGSVSTASQSRSVGFGVNQTWAQRKLPRGGIAPPQFPIQPLAAAPRLPRTTVPAATRSAIRTPALNRPFVPNPAVPRNVPLAQQERQSPGLPAANRIR